ncbi:obg [Symbiodinium sp. CCMP2592]|nr:obg [Symbiodinium sp. CCMP2592]
MAASAATSGRCSSAATMYCISAAWPTRSLTWTEGHGSFCGAVGWHPEVLGSKSHRDSVSLAVSSDDATSVERRQEKAGSFRRGGQGVQLTKLWRQCNQGGESEDQEDHSLMELKDRNRPNSSLRSLEAVAVEDASDDASEKDLNSSVELDPASSCASEESETPEEAEDGAVAAVAEGPLVSGDVDSEETALANVTRSEDLENLMSRCGNCSASEMVPAVSGLCATPAETETVGYVLTEVSLDSEDFSVQASCDGSIGFDGLATARKCDEPQEPYSLSGCTRTCLSNESVGYLVTETSLDRLNFEVSASCLPGWIGEAKAWPCSQVGEAYQLAGCSETKPDPASVCGLGSLGSGSNSSWTLEQARAFAEELLQFAGDLEAQLLHVQRVANISALSKTPHAAACAAALQQLGEEAQRQQLGAQRPRPWRLRALWRQLGARAAALDPRSPEAETLRRFDSVTAEAKAALQAMGEAEAEAEEASPASLLRNSRAGCDLQSVEAAGKRFEETLQGFRGQVISNMLPREVENLHRVVHTLEVARNSLLAHFEAADDPLQECERYFSGVSQLESDLAHYRNLLEPPKPQAQASPRPASQPLQAGQLPQLELAPSGSLPRAAIRGAGPALDARSFR